MALLRAAFTRLPARPPGGPPDPPSGAARGPRPPRCAGRPRALPLLGLAGLLLAGCGAGPAWVDVPSAVVDPQAIRHNAAVCAEQGLVWDSETWSCR